MDGFTELENTDDDFNMDYFLEQAHSREIAFYKLFPTYDPTLKMPKFYYGSEYNKADKSGIIIMEDMTVMATTTTVLPGFTHQYHFKINFHQIFNLKHEKNDSL